jgi:hypothetical protein
MSDIQKLLKKRATIEAKIKEAEKAEKRKIEVLKLLEASKILHLSDAVLIEGFDQIASQNQ